MNSDDFNKCRAFLEGQITESQDKKELLDVYRRLLELKSEHDKATTKAVIDKEIKEAELREKFSSTVHTQNTQHNMDLNRVAAGVQINRDNQLFGAYNATIPYFFPTHP